MRRFPLGFERLEVLSFGFELSKKLEAKMIPLSFEEQKLILQMTYLVELELMRGYYQKSYSYLQMDHLLLLLELLTILKQRELLE